MSQWEEYLESMKKSVTENLTNTSEGQKPESSTQKTKSSEECGTTCPKCNGTGWELYRDENGNEVARECECGIRQREIQENRLSFASIPVNYKDVTFADMKISYYSKQGSKDTLKAVRGLIKDYLENLEKEIADGKGIYLWSETKGSGKTMFATALANELIHKYHKTVKFATSLDILDEIRATYDKHSEESESKLLSDLVRTEFLVIDDFGTERATDWAGEKFYQIVNNRYINNKVTFYTSNCNLTTLKYDDRITNRIREKSYLVHFPEESVREYKARKENRSIE